MFYRLGHFVFLHKTYRRMCGDVPMGASAQQTIYNIFYRYLKQGKPCEAKADAGPIAAAGHQSPTPGCSWCCWAGPRPGLRARRGAARHPTAGAAGRAQRRPSYEPRSADCELFIVTLTHCRQLPFWMQCVNMPAPIFRYKSRKDSKCQPGLKFPGGP